MRQLKTILFITTAACLAAGLATAQTKPAAKKAAPAITPANYASSTEWPTYGHDSGGMRYSPLKQITAANVGKLGVAWVYHLKPEGYVAPAGRGGGGGRGGAPGAAPAAGAPPGVAPAAGAPAGAPDAAAAPGRGGGGGRGAPTGFQASEATPLVINGIMYVASPYGQVVALDAITGKEVWVYKLPSGNPATRGVEYFPGDKITPPEIVVSTSDSKLFALNAKTGDLNTKMGDNGFVTLEKGTSSPGIIYQNIYMVSGRSQENEGPGTGGDVHAYDIHDGKMLWTFHSVTQPGEKNFGTWFGDSWKQRAGVNVWGLMTVDVKRGIVYMPFGAPSGDLFGGSRPGDGLYGTSVVAADAKTGKYLWHFQVVHHDTWDFDLEAPPALFDVKQGKKTIPAIAVFGKSSLLFLLDRTTGKPIYGVEERPVQQSEVPGEKMSPTQPFPLKPPPLARINITADELNKLTPEMEAACKKLVDDNNVTLNNGPYAPPSYNHARAIFPSEIGGSDWGGGSFNPALGLLYINVNDLGQLNGLKDPAGGPVDLAKLPGSNNPGGRTGPYSGAGPGGRFAVRNADGTMILCNQPPWGELVAVNVNTGDIAWRVPLGISDDLPAALQNTGRPSQGGSITTASGLVFIGAAIDNRFRAIDGKTGKELWTVKMNASAESVPSTYLGKNGKQYVAVVTAGGGDAGAPVTSDELTAFTLMK